MPKETTTPPASTPTTTEEPELVAETPGFLQVTPEREDPISSPSPTTGEKSSSSSPSDPSASKSPSSTTPATGSSPASSDDGGIAAAQLAQLFGSVFDIAGIAVHDRLTPGDNDCWIPREGEREMVGGALARIAARHMPKGVGVASDLGDAIQAGVGLVLYGLTNAMRTPAVRHGATVPEAHEDREEYGQPDPAATAGFHA